MDCRTARKLLDASRPEGRDWQESELRAAAGHVDGCPGCPSALAARDRLDQMIAGAMRRVDIPAGLEARLLTRLAEACSEAAMPQPQPASLPRSRRRWLAALSSVAALVMLAVSGWYWLSRSEPVLTMHGVHGRLEESLFQYNDDGELQPQPLAAFDDSFDARIADAEWRSTVTGEPRGLDLDDVVGDDVAIYPFQTGRGVTGWLVVLPRQSLVDAPQASIPSRSQAHFGRGPQVAWTTGDQVYICVVGRGSLDGLLREMYGGTA
ncbi:MAG: hypothetical protein R3B90_02365 [Planctomycetaceae bacterium]